MRARPGYAAAIRERRKNDPEFKARRNAAVARWQAKPGSAAKQFAWYLKRTYGLTIEQHAALLSAQGHRCGICGSDDPGIRTKGKVHRWHVDHDHATGKVRGLLCGSCNIGLGSFFDNTVALRNAVVYLEKHRGDI
jgi:hypothetical protein